MVSVLVWPEVLGFNDIGVEPYAERLTAVCDCCIGCFLSYAKQRSVFLIKQQFQSSHCFLYNFAL